MLTTTFLQNDQLTPIEIEMVKFVNKNILSMVEMAIDMVENDEYAIHWYFPEHFCAKKSSECIEILYSLKNRLRSTVLYDDIKPIYKYVLFHIIEWWVDLMRDTFPEELQFKLPQKLRDGILNSVDWNYTENDIYEEDELDEENSDPIIITTLESAEEYIDICFDDTDFLEEDIRGAVQAAIHNPALFLTFSTYEELDKYMDVMPPDVVEEYQEFRNKKATHNIESIILTELVNISSILSTNASYGKHSIENAINDYYRDMLRAKGLFTVADQTRYGISASGKEAGEVDLLLRKDGKDIAVVEGLKLSYVDDASLKRHINKVLCNYNALGIPTYFLIYATTKKFDDFWNRLYSYLESYDYPFPTVENMGSIDVPFATVRVAGIMLQKESHCFTVGFIVINMDK